MSIGAPPVARDFMVTQVVALRPDMGIFEAVDVLLMNHIAGAPVVDEQRRILGFLSEKDCLKPLVDAAYESDPELTVGKCMAKDIRTISEDADALVVAELFMNHPYRRLPVVRDGVLVGQVSRRDFLKAVVEWIRPPSQPKRPSFLYLSRVQDPKDVAL